MNLNQAFKKRNKLQEEINTLKGMMSSKIVIKEAKEPENTRLLNGLTCEKWFALTNEKIAELIKLAIAIDKANEKVKPLLSQLNILKSQKAFLERLNGYIVDSPRKYYYAENDKTVYLELTIKQEEVLRQIDVLTAQIDELEEKVGQLNASTQVNVA